MKDVMKDAKLVDMLVEWMVVMKVGPMVAQLVELSDLLLG